MKHIKIVMNIFGAVWHVFMVPPAMGDEYEYHKPPPIGFKWWF